MKSINIEFPIQDSSEGTLFKMNQTTKDALRADLYLLLMTQKGERYYMPNYGTSLLEFIYEPNDQITSNDIEENIKNTVSRYIPSLKINKINFYKDIDENGFKISGNQLNIVVDFTYTDDAFSENDSITINLNV